MPDRRPDAGFSPLAEPTPAGGAIAASQFGGQIVYRYADRQGSPAGYPWNPNGSVDSIAGICDPTGRILGLMPHPERHCLPIHDPRWPREGLKEEGEGLRIFRRAVQFVQDKLAPRPELGTKAAPAA